MNIFALLRLFEKYKCDATGVTLCGKLLTDYHTQHELFQSHGAEAYISNGKGKEVLIPISFADLDQTEDFYERVVRYFKASRQPGGTSWLMVQSPEMNDVDLLDYLRVVYLPKRMICYKLMRDGFRGFVSGYKGKVHGVRFGLNGVETYTEAWMNSMQYMTDLYKSPNNEKYWDLMDFVVPARDDLHYMGKYLWVDMHHEVCFLKMPNFSRWLSLPLPDIYAGDYSNCPEVGEEIQFFKNTWAVEV